MYNYVLEFSPECIDLECYALGLFSVMRYISILLHYMTLLVAGVRFGGGGGIVGTYLSGYRGGEFKSMLNMLG